MNHISPQGNRSRTGKRGAVAVLTLLMTCLPAGLLAAQENGQPTAAPVNLSIEQAVNDALSHSSKLAGAVADWHGSQFSALEAQLQMIPSVSLSGSYTRLSDLPGSSFALGSYTVTLPASPSNAFAFGVNLQYPVFAGFRLREAARIAQLQSLGKQIGIDMVKRALTFEVRRAYWESVRASQNVLTMKKNLNLVQVIMKEVGDQVNQGLATQSDLLGAQERYNQAQIMLSDAVSQRNRAFLALASLLGQDAVGASLAKSGAAGFLSDLSSAYTLTTDPASTQFPALSGTLDPARLVSNALSNRPEALTAEVGLETAQHAAGAARGGLFPTVAITGDYTYANPNQRVFPANGEFTGTWDVGVHLSFDVGKLPATLAGVNSAEAGISRAQSLRADVLSQVTLDVRNTLLSYEQARQDLSMTRSMVKQADEDLRVTQQKYDNGLAKHSDVLQSELAVLRANFGVTNKEIDLQIAAADLVRAAALPGS